jgi:hypothetical protein
VRARPGQKGHHLRFWKPIVTFFFLTYIPSFRIFFIIQIPAKSTHTWALGSLEWGFWRRGWCFPGVWCVDTVLVAQVDALVHAPRFLASEGVSVAFALRHRWRWSFTFVCCKLRVDYSRVSRALKRCVGDGMASEIDVTLQI